MTARRVTVEELVPVAAGREVRTGPHKARFRSASLGRESLRLVPLGVGGLLDRAIELTLRHFGPCVLVSTLFFLPFQVASELVLRVDDFGGLTFLAQVLKSVPRMITLGFSLHLMGSDLLRRPTSVRASLETALVRLPSAALLVLPWLLLTTVGESCCLVPGLVIGWLGVGFLPTYLLERDELLERLPSAGRGPARWVNGLVHSVARGVGLVSGAAGAVRYAGWKVVQMGVAWLLIATPQSIESPPVREQIATYLGADSDLIFFLLAIFGSAFLGIAAILEAACVATYWVDQRIRKEALDVELERFGGRPA